MAYGMTLMPLNDLGGHFCCLKPFWTPIPHETWQEFANMVSRMVPLQ